MNACIITTPNAFLNYLNCASGQLVRLLFAMVILNLLSSLRASSTFLYLNVVIHVLRLA